MTLSYTDILVTIVIVAVVLYAAHRLGQATTTTSDPALATTNAALDENNDQNAKIIALLEANTALLAQLSASGGTASFDLASLASV